MSELLVPVLPHARVRAYPEHDVGARVAYYPLSVALGRRWGTDAHTAAYSMPVAPRRLAGDAPRALGGVTMVLAIFDIDGPGHVATDEWRRGERAKVAKLLRAMPRLFAYETRGGYRILGVRPQTVIILSPEDEEAWKRRYRADVNFLEREFGILADRSPSVSSWTCLFRLPRVRRDA